MTVMYDSVTLSQIPPNPPAVAGYVGGSFPTFSELVKRFPKAQHLSIAVNALEDAECLDVENGDAVPADAPGWFNRQKPRGVFRPVFYADTSTMPQVLLELGKAGITRTDFRVWTAHFTGVEHIEPGSDATQWTDRAHGLNLDQSLTVDTFFNAKPAPPAHNAIHYDWFDAEIRLGLKQSERTLVETYDRLRKHPVLNVLWLYPLRDKLLMLADRVRQVADDSRNLATDRPSWGQFHRGYRFQQLLGRASGQRFV